MHACYILQVSSGNVRNPVPSFVDYIGQNWAVQAIDWTAKSFWQKIFTEFCINSTHKIK